MKQGESISPINSYTESNKHLLWENWARWAFRGFAFSPDRDREETKREKEGASFLCAATF